jgi:hypothetical protein
VKFLQLFQQKKHETKKEFAPIQRKSECLERKRKKTKLYKPEKVPTILSKKKKKERDHFLSNEKSLFHFIVVGKFKFFRKLSKLDKKSSVKTLEGMKSPQHGSSCGP